MAPKPKGTDTGTDIAILDLSVQQLVLGLEANTTVLGKNNDRLHETNVELQGLKFKVANLEFSKVPEKDFTERTATVASKIVEAHAALDQASRTAWNWGAIKLTLAGSASAGGGAFLMWLNQ